MSRNTNPLLPYVAVPVTLHEGTDCPDLVVISNGEKTDIYLTPDELELNQLVLAGHKQERVRFPTAQLDRFADGGYRTIEEPGLYVAQDKGVVTIEFWIMKKVKIARKIGEQSLLKAYAMRDLLVNLVDDGSLSAFQNLLKSPGNQAAAQGNGRNGGQDQRQPDQGRRGARQPDNQQERPQGQQQGRRNGQGRNNASSQPPRQPQAETRKVEAAPQPAPAVETPVETEVTTPTPVATQRPSQPRKARGERAVKKVTPGRNGERSTKLGDVFAGLKLPTGSKAAEEPAPTATADSACECQETIDPNTSNDAVEEKAPANAAEAAATPVANDQATETASDPVAGEVAETKEFGNALRKSVGDGTSAEQPITFTV